MSKEPFSKGNANRETLADRMKKYEAITTSTNLIERLPIYARIDMRAGHTWCKNLDKPFDIAFSDSMKYATSYIVEKTGAILGYCQSDEASFCWIDHTKLPFGTRLFKLESVFASMFTAAFIKSCMRSKLASMLNIVLPSFDCRVMNLPNINEMANMILWREKDSIKNSITLLALEHFSNDDLHKKNSKDKINMLKDVGVDYYVDIPEDLRSGAFFRREVFRREVTTYEIAKRPLVKWPEPDADGKIYVMRSRVVQFSIGMPLISVANRIGVLFANESPVLVNDAAVVEAVSED